MKTLTHEIIFAAENYAEETSLHNVFGLGATLTPGSLYKRSLYQPLRDKK
jgi:hypothetical protein